MNSDALGVLSSIEVPITVRFGSTHCLLQDLVRLKAGSSIEVNQRVDEPVEILVNGKLVARGEAVVVQGNYAIRITEVKQRKEMK